MPAKPPKPPREEVWGKEDRVNAYGRPIPKPTVKKPKPKPKPERRPVDERGVVHRRGYK